MKATYIGDDSQSGPTFVEVAGVRFPLNVPVSIPAGKERDFGKLRTNRFFRVEDEAPANPPTYGQSAPPPASPVAPSAPPQQSADPDIAQGRRIPSPPNFATPAPGAGAPSQGQGAAHVGGVLPGLPGNPSKG